MVGAIVIGNGFCEGRRNGDGEDEDGDEEAGDVGTDRNGGRGSSSKAGFEQDTAGWK